MFNVFVCLHMHVSIICAVWICVCVCVCVYLFCYSAHPPTPLSALKQQLCNAAGYSTRSPVMSRSSASVLPPTKPPPPGAEDTPTSKMWGCNSHRSQVQQCQPKQGSLLKSCRLCKQYACMVYFNGWLHFYVWCMPLPCFHYWTKFYSFSKIIFFFLSFRSFMK